MVSTSVSHQTYSQAASHTYRAYGLLLRSALALPELMPAPAGGPVDVAITWGPVSREQPPEADPEGFVVAEGAAARIVVAGVGAIRILAGRSIVVDPDPGCEERVLRLFLLGGALGLLLHQRGLTTLHASAVVTGQGVAVFVGDSGEGKSTMAAALNARGLALLADDVVACAVRGAEALVLPAFPQLKLWPDSSEALGDDPATTRLIHPDLNKLARRAGGPFPTTPLPARAIYVLETSEREAVNRLEPADAFAAVKRYAYAAGLLGPAGMTAAHFHQLVALAGVVPVYRFERPHDYTRLPAVVERVLAHLAASAPLTNEASR